MVSPGLLPFFVDGQFHFRYSFAIESMTSAYANTAPSSAESRASRTALCVPATSQSHLAKTAESGASHRPIAAAPTAVLISVGSNAVCSEATSLQAPRLDAVDSDQVLAKQENKAVPPPQESWASLHVLSSAYLEPWETGRVDDSVRFDAACHLDGQLLRIAALEIPCRILLSRLARAMTTRRGWQRLGFSRIGDYTSERLGLKARCVQEDVRVISALDDLPRIRSALCRGEIRWTSARIITRIATATDEAFWLDRALTRTTRQLDAEVKEARKARLDGSADCEQRVATPDQEAAAQSISQADQETNSPEIESANLCRADLESAEPTNEDRPPTDPANTEPYDKNPNDTGPNDTAANRAVPDNTFSDNTVSDNAAPNCNDPTPNDSDPALATEETERVRWTLRCSRRGRRRWRQIRELAERMAGSRLTGEQVLELVCAEVSAFLPPEPPSADAPTARDAHRDEILAGQRKPPPDFFSTTGWTTEQRIAAFESEVGVSEGFAHALPPTLALAERLPAELAALAEGLDDGFGSDEFSGDGFKDCPNDGADGGSNKSYGAPINVGVLGSAPASDDRGISISGGDRADSDKSVDDGFEVNADDLGDPNSSRQSPFLAPPDAFELDRRLRMVQRAIQSLDWQLGTVLRSLVDHRLYRDLGFANFKLYCDARLGIDSRKANQLVRLERSTWQHSPLLRDAYREGRISRLAALTILPVFSKRYAAAWIERASEVTLRRLNDEVSWSAERMDEGPYGRPVPPPPADLDVHRELFGPPVFASSTSNPVSPTNQGASDEGTSGEPALGETPSEEAAAAERALGKTASGEGASDDGGPKQSTTDQTPTNNDATDEAAVDGNATREEAAYQGASEEGSMRTLLGRERDPDLFGGTRVTIEADIETIIFLEETLDRASRFLENRLRASEERSPDRPTAGERETLATDPTNSSNSTDPTNSSNLTCPADLTPPGRRISRWQVFEWLLEQAAAEWCAQPRHRDPVFERDGWRCSVPGCSARRELEDHHIVFRSHGGGNEVTNRIAVCHWHHHHAIHEGIVRASGPAPHGLRWQIGCRHRGPALFGAWPHTDGRPLLKLHGERYEH